MVVNEVGGEIEIRLDAQVKALNIVGNATLSYGYPTDGERGDLLAAYTVVYEDGEEQTIPLRNGLELVTAQGLFGSSPIDPQAPYLQRAFTIRYDTNWEIYHINAFRFSTQSSKKIRCLRCRTLDKRVSVLLYGITFDTL